MKKKDYLRLVLILAIFFLALGGWLLHLRIHPLAKDAEHYIPFAAGFISVFVIPVLFIFTSTIAFAYLLNGMTVIIGTITMAHFSLENPPHVWMLQTIFFGTLLADIMLLWGKFAVGKALFDLEPVNKPTRHSDKQRQVFPFSEYGLLFCSPCHINRCLPYRHLFLEIGGGYHEIFYVIPAGRAGITCCGDFTAALDRPSVNR